MAMIAFWAWFTETMKIAWMITSWLIERNNEKKKQKKQLIDDLNDANTQQQIEDIFNSYYRL